MATKRLKELLESRKASSRETSGWQIYISFLCIFLFYNNSLLTFFKAGAGNGNGPGIQVITDVKF